jgi:tetratricopeptide (TPR) repeat protein
MHTEVRRLSVNGHTIASVDDIPELDDGRVPMRPVRHHFGITGFGVNAWTAPNAGDRVINEHAEDEDADEELYVVLRGHAVFELDGERRDAPQGTLVFVRPGVNRTAFAEEAGTTIVSIGGTPGKPYDPSGWEVWAPLRPRYEAGDYAEVIARGLEILEANPQYALLYFNVACCESLVGETEPALEHLRRAIELSPRFREYALGDTDLDAIRDDPRFAEMTAAA